MSENEIKQQTAGRLEAIIGPPRLQLVSLSAFHDSRAGTFLYGLDVKGDAWVKQPSEVWKRVDMQIEGCPECSHAKDKPKTYSEADGHGGLRRYCTNAFHG